MSQKPVSCERFIANSTVECIRSGCVACLYKAFPSGAASICDPSLLAAAARFPRNTRPENCLRAKNPVYHGLQSLKRRVCIVGDGDFSFSLAVANSDPKRAQKHLVVSSFESESSLRSIYTNGAQNIASLQSLGVQTLFGVDATRLDQVPELAGKRFDVILFNFPCVCVDRGADGQASELEQNQALVRSFFGNACAFLEDSGEIHVTHKTIEPFSWWGISELAAEQGLQLVFDVVFDKYNYPGYTNRKALDKKSFTCNDARTFVYTRQDCGKAANDIIERHAKRISPFQERELLRLVLQLKDTTTTADAGAGSSASLAESKKRKLPSADSEGGKQHQRWS